VIPEGLVPDARSLLTGLAECESGLYAIPAQYIKEAGFQANNELPSPVRRRLELAMSKKYENLLAHGFVDVFIFDGLKNEYQKLDHIESMAELRNLSNYDPELVRTSCVVIKASAAARKFLSDTMFQD
jgi:hypothetical protein